MAGPEQSTRHNREWDESVERFASLRPAELVALARATYEADYSRNKTDLEQTGRPVYSDSFFGYFDNLIAYDLDRATEVITAFVDSPIPQDRFFVALGAVEQLTRVSRERGIPLWDRLMSDPDADIRNMVAEGLAAKLDCVTRVVGGYRGFYSVDDADEAQLTAEFGLTRQDAHDLYLTYAYATNGIYFDLGRTALAKINAIEPPDQ